jgi:hypothetical protein
MAPDMFSGWGVRTLSSDSPALGHAELGDVRVGDARVSLGFARDERRTTFSLLQQHGDVIVTMAAGQAGAGR